VILAFDDEETPAGFALFFYNYSTFRAKAGIYLEDLFVEPALRGKGFGKALLNEVIRIAQKRGCGRVEWSVLNWNTPAISFYQSMGAKPMDEWTVYRITL
jgi:GNAT superfamily N-acetyltransferase